MVNHTPELRRELYPEIEPYRTGVLRLDALHEMYWEECGNPEGAPVVFLHGGPGAGAAPAHRRFFDPAHYRIVIYDQRGAGRSRPLGEVQANTSSLLVHDLERLRQHLGISHWLVFGGSWGSTLALAYGITHPQRCKGFILRGIFLCGTGEIDWFLYGIRHLFPEAWRAFSSAIPADERSDLLGAYYRRLIDPDPEIHMPAARAWSIYEGSCSTLRPSAETVAHFASDAVALGLARIEAHYFSHDILLVEDALINGIDRVRDLPAVIVQGRYDAVCPIVTADKLHAAWPQAQYIIVPDAGHSAWEPGVCAELVQAAEQFKSLTISKPPLTKQR